MTEKESQPPPGSVWAQFNSPVLENARVIDFECMNPQDEARQVEIRKVRESIDEMNVLLAEMQEMYQAPSSEPSPADGSSPSEAYVTAFDQTNSPSSAMVGGATSPLGRKPSLAFGMLSEKPRNSNFTQVEHLEGPQRKLRIDSPKRRESLHASVLSAASVPEGSRRSVSLASPKRDSRDSAEPLPQRSPVRSSPQRARAVSQPAQKSPSRDPRNHPHPKGHALHHAQQHKHPRPATSPAAQPRRPGARTSFTPENIKQQLNNTTELSIENIDLPASERKLLERFITALSKLSIEVQMDEAKRQEGRRRMNNALRALEGWI